MAQLADKPVMFDSLWLASEIGTKVKFDFVLNISAPYCYSVMDHNWPLHFLPKDSIKFAKFDQRNAEKKSLADHFSVTTEVKSFRANSFLDDIYPQLYAYLRDKRGLCPLVATPSPPCWSPR